MLLERRGSIVSHLVTNRAVDSHNVFIGHCNSVPKRICIGVSIANRQHHEVPGLDCKPVATVWWNSGWGQRGCQWQSLMGQKDMGRCLPPPSIGGPFSGMGQFQHTVKNNDRQCWSLGGAHLGLASARRAASRVCDHFVQPDECAAGATRQHSLAPRHQPCSGQSQCFHRSLQQRTQADLHRRQHCQSPAPRSPWAGLQTGGNGLVEFRMGPTGVSVAIVDGSKRHGQVSTPPIYWRAIFGNGSISFGQVSTPFMRCESKMCGQVSTPLGGWWIKNQKRYGQAPTPCRGWQLKKDMDRRPPLAGVGDSKKTWTGVHPLQGLVTQKRHGQAPTPCRGW